jgi:hypothetical protein
MLKPTEENGGSAMLQQLAHADLLEPALFEPYYFEYEITTAAVSIFERFLASPIKANRRHALIALVRCTTAVGYALDAFMLHMHANYKPPTIALPLERNRIRPWPTNVKDSEKPEISPPFAFVREFSPHKWYESGTEPRPHLNHWTGRRTRRAHK